MQRGRCLWQPAPMWTEKDSRYQILCYVAPFSLEDARSSNSNCSNWITEKRLCPTSTSCCVGLTPTELPCWCHDMAAEPQSSMAELRDDFNCARSCLDRKCLWYGRPDLHTGDRNAGKDMTNTELGLGCQSMNQPKAWWLRSKKCHGTPLLSSHTGLDKA